MARTNSSFGSTLAVALCLGHLVFPRVSPCAAQESGAFPYVAYVTAPQAFVRSGPGQKYYPTQQLPRGHAVEVYRHDGDAWCAIRPPEGSFSWVAEHEIQRVNSHTATVVVENMMARVGSGLSADRSNVQVMLHRGERVQLLPGTPANSRWVKIAPPAGEFRWFPAADLSRTPPVETGTALLPGTSWSRRGGNDTAEKIADQVKLGFAHLVQNTAPLRSAPVSQQATVAAPPVPSAQGQQLSPQPGAERVAVIPGSPASLDTSNSATSSAPPPNEPAPFPTPNPYSKSTGDQTQMPWSPLPRIRFGNSVSVLGPAPDRVEELQLRLSQTVIRPKEEWQFDQLKAEATALLEKSDSVSEREHLRNILDRIALFERVQHGVPSEPLATHEEHLTTRDDQTEFTGLTTRVRETAQRDLSQQRSDPFEPAPPNTDEPRYDAVGRLKPVVSEDTTAPRFALVDDQGAVVSFVTPTPDINLQPYVGMRIGVNGSRGFMPEYRTAHVTAARVTPIEDRLRR